MAVPIATMPQQIAKKINLVPQLDLTKVAPNFSKKQQEKEMQHYKQMQKEIEKIM